MSQITADQQAIELASVAVASATGLLITAGAGMSCDSGLPDYRGPGGIYRKCPQTGVEYTLLSERGMFFTDPSLAWGHHASALRRYDNAHPHDGYRALLQIAHRLPQGYRVFTSNVDGLFQRAGFDRDLIVECHGSLRTLQCLDASCDTRGSTYDWPFVIDPETLRCVSPLPRCSCGHLLRPNVCLFNDGPNWRGQPYHRQESEVRHWLRSVSRLVVIEIGSGGGVPTVRTFGTGCARDAGAAFIRVNLRSPWARDVPGGIGISGTALAVVPALEAAVNTAFSSRLAVHCSD
ncbi:MAG: hypothetical protein E6R08_00730 [Nevskiaceae bacterium]|nr:MAG: hypothetical protein E6R08_00730 [Nevskiaceae bacterium]